MTPLVFITGASSGIGQSLAWRYYQAGYSLALVARRTAEIQAWATERGLQVDRFAVYSADVAVADSIVAAAQQCLQQQGLPDVVIANAGISIGMDTADRADLDVMARTFATNNVGLAATFHAFIDGMVRRGSGRLVGVGSVAGIRGLPGTVPTAPAKRPSLPTVKACGVSCVTRASRSLPFAQVISIRPSRGRTAIRCRF